MKIIYLVLGAILIALIAAIAIEPKLQERDDRVLDEEIDRTASELQVIGSNIADIRDAHLTDINDYVSAYGGSSPC